MAEFEIPKHGEICWRELATRDLLAALEFYKAMFGWELIQSNVSPVDYKEIVVGGIAYGGMMAIDENWGPEPPPSFWTNYIAVDNCDETVEKIKALGGGITCEAFDAPGVGRIAMAMDPSGAAFSIIQFNMQG
ncbi:MAG: VOC family protein [Acidobacteriota bacterium]|nr:MAG: VOC family protein [Acidobacteriota bacterium]